MDVVFATSPQLEISHKQWNRNTFFFGNVADHIHFNRALLGDLSGPLSCPERLQVLDRPGLLFMGAIDAYKLIWACCCNWWSATLLGRLC